MRELRDRRFAAADLDGRLFFLIKYGSREGMCGGSYDSRGRKLRFARQKLNAEYAACADNDRYIIAEHLDTRTIGASYRRPTGVQVFSKAVSVVVCVIV
jgi:hypothetical protein